MGSRQKIQKCRIADFWPGIDDLEMYTVDPGSVTVSTFLMRSYVTIRLLKIEVVFWRSVSSGGAFRAYREPIDKSLLRGRIAPLVSGKSMNFLPLTLWNFQQIDSEPYGVHGVQITTRTSLFLKERLTKILCGVDDKI